MKTIMLALVLNVIAPAAYGQALPLHVHEEDGISVRLMPGPCVDPVSKANILPAHVARAKAIASDWRMMDGNMKPFAGCWIELTKEEAKSAQNLFVLFFSDGEIISVYTSAFGKKPRGATGI